MSRFQQHSITIFGPRSFGQAHPIPTGALGISSSSMAIKNPKAANRDSQVSLDFTHTWSLHAPLKNGGQYPKLRGDDPFCSRGHGDLQWTEANGPRRLTLTRKTPTSLWIPPRHVAVIFPVRHSETLLGLGPWESGVGNLGWEVRHEVVKLPVGCWATSRFP